MAQPSLNEWEILHPSGRDWKRTFKLDTEYVSDKPPAFGKVVAIRIITSDGRFLLETIEHPTKPNEVGNARWTSVKSFANRFIERKQS